MLDSVDPITKLDAALRALYRLPDTLVVRRNRGQLFSIAPGAGDRTIDPAGPFSMDYRIGRKVFRAKQGYTYMETPVDGVSAGTARQLCLCMRSDCRTVHSEGFRSEMNDRS